MDRRKFLTALALASGGLCSLSLDRRVVAADPSPAPKRLILVVTQQGVWHPTWAFNPANLPLDQAWTVDLHDTDQAAWSAGLAPLHHLRDRLTIVDGLSLASGDADPAAVLRHEIGEVQSLSGTFVELVAGVPSSPVATIDQVVADQIARADRLRSIEIGVGQPPFTINYRGRLQMLPAETRLPVVWDRLFGLVGGGHDAALAAEQAAILERVEQRYAAMAPRLSGEDRHKLELHRDLIRDLGVQIEGLLECECELPSLPPPELDYGHYGQSFTLAVELLRAAMACDLVRVATLHLGDIPGETLGLPGAKIHTDFAHDVFISEEARVLMTDYTAYHAAQLAELIEALDGVPEGDGTMLDHTLIVWISELGDGAHGFDKWPCVLAGGQAWPNGRMIHLPRDQPFDTWTWDGVGLPTTGRPHQHLLNSIARAFDLRGPDGADWQAPLSEFHDRAGHRIDARGTIERLFVG